ncbi:DUF1707 domain-containing protein [Actinomadura sp. KC06]|uniref:DUF1707 SHOCT-like domain-containing protein n=1 Tax=Actinomadura sp. KC06 TaxID=2530369 RepID=UPI001053BB04|nr:DUF1707 domain-containing protein [Actinomadura sp. KC06]TDD27352.1 DUF1707 domain-containing protein [Actinomadura sp. KC06]
MPSRSQVRPRTSARSLLGGVLLSAALLYVTRDLTVPVCVLYAVIVVSTVLTARAYIAQDRAVLRADEQQRRADILASPRPTDGVTALRYGDPDERVGHADREAVLELLGERYATGHLTADEHEARATEATQARTRSQLAHVLRNLP